MLAGRTRSMQRRLDHATEIMDSMRALVATARALARESDRAKAHALNVWADIKVTIRALQLPWRLYRSIADYRPCASCPRVNEFGNAMSIIAERAGLGYIQPLFTGSGEVEVELMPNARGVYTFMQRVAHERTGSGELDDSVRASVARLDELMLLLNQLTDPRLHATEIADARAGRFATSVSYQRDILAFTVRSMRRLLDTYEASVRTEHPRLLEASDVIQRSTLAYTEKVVDGLRALGFDRSDPGRFAIAVGAFDEMTAAMVVSRDARTRNTLTPLFVVGEAAAAAAAAGSSGAGGQASDGVSASGALPAPGALVLNA